MKFKSLLILIAVIFVSCKDASKQNQADTPTTTPEKSQPKWQLVQTVNDLPQPESVVFSKSQNAFFVSNQNQAEEGFISKLNADGSIADKHWVKGLVNPKGIEIVDNTLYVSDETVLVEIDINKAEIVKKHKGEAAKFLNDVASDSNGNIYVSDMMTSAIYKLDTKGNFTNWLQSENLENPNGLLVKNNDLYLACWGKNLDTNTFSSDAGNVLKINLSDKKVTTVSETPIGNLDGLQAYKNGFIISDWINGNIYNFKNGKATEIFKTKKGSGDIAIVNDNIYIPMALENEVLVYKLQ